MKLAVLAIIFLFTASLAFADGQGGNPGNGPRDNAMAYGTLEKGQNQTQDENLTVEMNGGGQGGNPYGNAQGNQNNGKGTDSGGNTSTEGDLNHTQGRNNTKNESGMGNQGNATENESGKNGQINDSEKGNIVSNTVHQLIEYRKNGSLEIPQGILVRIEAQNRMMNFGNLTQIALNETLIFNLSHGNANRTVKISPNKNGLEIEDGDSVATTNETLELENSSIYLGKKKINLLPSEVNGRINAKRINSQQLAISEGEPAYMVNATRNARILWLFESEMEVLSTVNAASGEIMNEKRPWWAFMSAVE